VNQVQHMVNDIADASVEQSSGISQVSLAVSHLDIITQKNLSMVQEAAQATAQQQEQSDALLDTLLRFTLNERQLTAPETDELSGVDASAPSQSGMPRHFLAAPAAQVSYA